MTISESPTNTERNSPPAIVLAGRDVAGMTVRNLRRLLRTPQLLLLSVLQPVILLVLFRYVLGGAIRGPGVHYVDFVVPGIMVEAVLIGGMSTSVSLATDLQSGALDRFRSLPMARFAYLGGRTVADFVRSTVALSVMIVLGLAVGFRFDATPASVLLGIAVILFFGFAFLWVNATIGLLVKNPETAQVASLLPFFVLMFASSALVPVSTMPSWLQPFARNQPMSLVIDLTRALFEGGAVAGLLWRVLAWSVGILVMFFLLGLHLYRNA